MIKSTSPTQLTLLPQPDRCGSTVSAAANGTGIYTAISPEGRLRMRKGESRQSH